MTIDVGESPEALRTLPTDLRLEKYREGGSDPDLGELLFQYARCLMISSSRPRNLPANLQGLWNNSNVPPWRVIITRMSILKRTTGSWMPTILPKHPAWVAQVSREWPPNLSALHKAAGVTSDHG
ncbi:MAG: hypothetical protein WHT09_06005 [Thermogutta sp.]|jgi:alpha-L-fucosidase 2